MTDEELDAIKARADAATPGPWRTGWMMRRCKKQHPHEGEHVFEADSWIDAAHDISQVNEPHALVVCTTDEYGAMLPADSEFIAHAREDVPALLAYISELHEQIDANYADETDGLYRLDELD